MGRRLSQRVRVKMDFFCHDMSFSGTILNLSGNGMLILSSSIDFPFQTQFKIRVPLQKEEIEIDVKVNRLIKTNHYYDVMAVELINPSRNYLDFVEELKNSQKIMSKLNIIINPN